jgi:hypothetical protein
MVGSCSWSKSSGASGALTTLTLQAKALPSPKQNAIDSVEPNCSNSWVTLRSLRHACVHATLARSTGPCIAGCVRRMFTK